MTNRLYNGREIQVIELDDAISEEHVVEFRDPALSSTDSVVAVFNSGVDWSTARVTLSPRVDSLPADFVFWALGIARNIIEKE
jgi:hypothetical protein